MSSRTRSRTPRGAPKFKLEDVDCRIINMKNRKDRWSRVTVMLKNELPWLQFKRFNASNGREDNIPENRVAQVWNTKDNSLYGRYEDLMFKGRLYKAEEFTEPGVLYTMSPGERGCAYSHYRLWQIAAKKPDHEPLLVLEDDISLAFQRKMKKFGTMNGGVFTDRVKMALAEAPRDIDVLYLGWAGHRAGNYKYHKDKKGPKSSIIREVEYVWTTIAYFIWPAGARKLLARASPMDQPVDNFMAWEARQGNLKSFIVLDEADTNKTWDGGIVNQFDFWNDSDVKKSDGGDQGESATKYMIGLAA